MHITEYVSMFALKKNNIKKKKKKRYTIQDNGLYKREGSDPSRWQVTLCTT